MSAFSVLIKRVRAIEPHPNADNIEFAIIDGYRSIVKKDTVFPGQLVAYIPESALIPEWLLKHLGFWNDQKGCGTLAGSDGNRVRAIKLRGEVSQGICYPTNYINETNVLSIIGSNEISTSVPVYENEEVSQLLGITKYEPPVPVIFSSGNFDAGFNVGTENTLSFDVENWKSYPEVLIDGEEVIFTEKLHGTCTIVAILPYERSLSEAFGEKKNILIFSKGIGSRGIAFKNDPCNQNNLYICSTRTLIENIDRGQQEDLNGPPHPIFILGETIGPGVQDLAYCKYVCLKVFAVAHREYGKILYQDWDKVCGPLKAKFGFETVPVLYRGPFSKAVMKEYTDGKTSLESGHMREGIVITPVVERYETNLGRVCLKSVSDHYLTRKNGTEYN